MPPSIAENPHAPSTSIKLLTVLAFALALLFSLPSWAAITITQQPKSLTLKTGDNAWTRVLAESTSTLSYQWYKDGVALSKSTKNALWIGGVTTANAGTYFVRIRDASGTLDSQKITITVDGISGSGSTSTSTSTAISDLVITRQPSNLKLAVGANAWTKVTASSSSTITYQWYKNGSPMSNRTKDALWIGSVTEADTGWYKVAVTSGGKTIFSNEISIVVGNGTLPSSSGTVTSPTTGLGTLYWSAPTTRANGTKLDPADISKYRIYRENCSGKVLSIYEAFQTSLSIDKLNLTTGTYCFFITAVDDTGRESNYSPGVRVTK